MANELRSPCANYLEQSELRDRIREVIEVERRAWNKTAAAGATVHFLADELSHALDELEYLKKQILEVLPSIGETLHSSGSISGWEDSREGLRNFMAEFGPKKGEP